MTQPGSRDQCIVRKLDTVVRLVPVTQAVQHLNGLFHGRLVHKDRREATLQGCITLYVLAVIVQSCGAYTLQLASCQSRLHHVAGIHRTLGSARPYHRMQFVDKQNYLALGPLDFLHGRFEPLFEFPTKAGSGDQCTQIETDNPLAHQYLGYVVAGDLLCQSLDNGRLAHPRLANQNRVALRAPTEHLYEAQYLIVASDNRVQLVLRSHLGEVAAVFLQSPVVAFRMGAGDSLPTAHFFDCLQHRLTVDTRFPENAGGGRATLSMHSQEDMLG